MQCPLSDSYTHLDVYKSQPKGLTLELTGDSNDYLGKGLSGGKIIVKTPHEATFKAEDKMCIRDRVCIIVLSISKKKLSKRL